MPARLKMGRLRVKILAKYFAVAGIVYFFIAIIGSLNSHSKAYERYMYAEPFSHLPSSNMSAHSEIVAKCETIHVAIILTGPDTVPPFIHMLKTLVYYRKNPIVFHVLDTETSRLIVSTLLDSWAIPGITTHFYRLPEKLGHAREGISLKDVFLAPSLLPKSIDKVILLTERIRFADDILPLWNLFSHFSDRAIGVHSERRGNDAKFSDDLILLHLRNWRRTNFADDLKNPSSTTAINEWLKTKEDNLYMLPCEWTVRLQAKFDLTKYLQGKHPKAFVWDDKSGQTWFRDQLTEQLKQTVQSVFLRDGELLRDAVSPCFKRNYELFSVAETCAEFRYAARIKRRTHLYIHGKPPPGDHWHDDPHDISLVTQLTPDRFSVLDRMAGHWEGPLHAVFHLTEEEAAMLPALVSSSKIIKNRANIAFHAVYKRGLFYPINYLRNVGIRQVSTPYTLFVDVDLVPNRGIYKELRRRIGTDLKRPNQTLVVPAFEALQPLSAVPNTKSELLALMGNKTVQGYRMSKGWNLGHKPTNYPKWMKAREPYTAIFKDAFEPYVVLRTKDQPLFEEKLLERMGDKIAYGRILYAMGYEFLILPDQYVIHLPHPVSKGTNMWKKYPGYGRCGGILFEEFRKWTKRKYPGQKV